VLELANVVYAVSRVVRAARGAGSGEVRGQRVEDGGRTSDGHLTPTLSPSGGEGGFRWKRNALRHSFCSYRLAEVKNAAQVSLEAGNSPQMIFQHYRELVTEQEAGAWFGITPEAAKAVRERVEAKQAAKVVRFPAKAAA
jgi:hypothetical protein